MQKPLKTFICYAHEDRSTVSGIRSHLKPLERSGLVSVWHDVEILPGQHWDKSIKAQLQEADLVLLFVSVDFIASDYIEKTELHAALERQKAGEITLIPIIVRPCEWQDYFGMGQFQALPNGGHPILSRHHPYTDEVHHAVVQGIKRVAQDMQAKRDAKAPPSDKTIPTSPSIDEIVPHDKTIEARHHRRDEAAWKAALAADNLETYESYLDFYHIHAEEAHERIEAFVAENLRQNAAKKQEAKSLFEPIKKPENKPAEQDSPNMPEMVFVKRGMFVMGNDSEGEADEKPAHEVTMPSFWIGKYLVTFGEYDRFCEATQRKKPKDEGWGRGRRPVINVSLEDIDDYCEWLADETGKFFRLPSEAEWEYAARGGDVATRITKYAGKNDVNRVAWYEENSDGQSHPVGEKTANDLGIYDLSGNVWEICADVWHDSYKNAPTDGSPWISEGKANRSVVRGGAWDCDSTGCRVTYRAWTGDNPDSCTGFRLAQSAE